MRPSASSFSRSRAGFPVLLLLLLAPLASAECIHYSDYFHVLDVKYGGGYKRALTWAEPYLFTADEAERFLVFDASDPADLRPRGGLDLGALPHDVCVRGSVAYVTLEDDRLQLIDVSDPDAPIMLGALTLPSSPQCVDVSGSWACVTVWEYLHSDYGLYVVDVSDPAAPAAVSFLPIGNYPHEVSVKGDRVLVAHGDLTVVSIADPHQPVVLGTASIPASAWYVTQRDDYAYVVSGDYELYTESYGLYVVDLSDSTQPVVVGWADPGAYVHDGVELWGDYAVVGSGELGFAFVDISNPTSPRVADLFGAREGTVEFVVAGSHLFAADTGLASFWLGDEHLPEPAAVVPFAGEPCAVAAAGDHAFAAGYWGGTFLALDLADPEHPEVIGTLEIPGAQYAALALAEEGANPAILYAADPHNDFVYVIDVSDPRLPVHVNTLPGFNSPSDLAVGAGHLYLVANNLYILDLVDPVHPQLVGSMDFTFSLQTVDAQGPTLYVGSRVLYHHNLRIIDASSPSKPRLVVETSLAECPYDVRVEGSLVYVADGMSGLLILEVAEGSTPRVLSRMPEVGSASSVQLEHGLAYVADDGRHAGMHVVDVSDPVAPRMIGFFPADGARDLELVNGHALIAAAHQGLLVAPLECDAAAVWPATGPGVGLTPVLMCLQNPAPGEATLLLELGRAGEARVAIHDAQGRLVRRLHDGPLARGQHTFRWNGRAPSGSPCPAGVYFARLIAGSTASERRLVLVR